MIKDREYKKWLDKFSNRHNADFDGFERYSLTWNQITEIIDEERQAWEENLTKHNNDLTKIPIGEDKNDKPSKR